MLQYILFFCLVVTATGQGCQTAPNLSCAEDVAGTFLSIHNSVTRRTVMQREQLDVVLLVDEGALEKFQHYWTKQLLRILSEIFVISPEYTRVSIVTFGTTSKVVVPMTDNADVCSFTQSINKMTLTPGNSYLSFGAASAISQLRNGRSKAVKLTILVTNGNWGNLGADPKAEANKLKSLGYLAAIILKQPNKDVGLIRDVIFDYFVSHFGSKKLGFTVEMSAPYLRKLHTIVQHNKAVGTDWPLDMEVSKTKCSAVGRVCSATETCICEIRTISNEYICVGQDVDPPEAMNCEGPSSPITVQSTNDTALVTWSKPMFSDNGGVVQTVTSRLPGVYPVGSYQITATSTDQEMNKATCTFSFTVTS